MNPLRIVAARVRGWFRRNVIADEIREELNSHLDARIAQYEREGLSRAEAERRARERVGNLAVHQDRGYDVRGGGALDTFTRERGFAWRGIRSRGWRAAFVVSLLGLTLAANAVVFSAADAFVFRTVPYRDPDSLVVIQKTSRLLGTND